MNNVEKLFSDPGRRWRNSVSEPPPVNRKLLIHAGQTVMVGRIVPDHENEMEDVVWESRWETTNDDCIERWSYIRKDSGRSVGAAR